jgi:hypothetical protein
VVVEAVVGELLHTPSQASRDERPAEAGTESHG